MNTRKQSFQFLKGLDWTPESDQLLHPSLIATYRLRVVAVGALITASTLANLMVYMALSGHGQLNINGFLIVMLMGIIGLGGVILTPWSRLLVSKWASRALYGWSVYGVLVIGVAIYFDGGGTSVLYLMFPVLTVFFAIAYPHRVQLFLFLLTLAIYCTAVALQTWNITAASMYIRVATLTTMAYVASVLSGWLINEMRDRAMSSSTAEQRAGMLDTVARAARRVSSLDATHILSGALAGALELGCVEAEVWLHEDASELKLRCQMGEHAEDSSDALTGGALAEELFIKLRISGMTQITGEGSFRHVACMLHREGEPSGVLLVQMPEAASTDILLIECIELLAAQVSAGLDVARNVAERRGLEERLAHWAFHDSLTDLPNRVLFADRLELALARTARDGSHVAVLFMDLDNFKSVNDTLGHAAGDELLHGVAHRLHGCLRPNDTLARYGGDEFVVLVEHIDGPDAAILVANRILDALAKPIAVAGRDLEVKTSIGIALDGARPGADADVLRRADIAMYQAKAAGGACYVLSPNPVIPEPEQEEAS